MLDVSHPSCTSFSLSGVQVAVCLVLSPRWMTVGLMLRGTGKQETYQDIHVAASTTLQSCSLNELSPSDSRTATELDSGRTKVAASGKNSLNKPPLNALLPASTVVQLPVTSDGSKIQHEGCVVVEEIASAPANWDEKGQIEERRQRGLSQEASTSQSHDTSPADSPATAAAQGSSSRSPVKVPSALYFCRYLSCHA